MNTTNEHYQGTHQEFPSVGEKFCLRDGEDETRDQDEIIDAEVIDDQPSTEVTISEQRDDVNTLCEAMAVSVERRTGRKPTITKAWKTQARLMLDRDRISLRDALAALAWAEQDDFWMANILSIPKLRKQYATLSLQAARKQRRPKTFREAFEQAGYDVSSEAIGNFLNTNRNRKTPEGSPF